MTNNIGGVKRALFSLSDKTDCVEFAKRALALGYELLSTGGTAKCLKEAGLQVTDVSAVTNFPEILSGRVKTLHSKIHAGLLARFDEPEHSRQLFEHGIQPIDLVYINLYPFEETVKSGADFDEIIENIDIGGPAMLRAAAKNHQYVNVVTCAEDMHDLLDFMEANGSSDLEKRRRLALRAFARTAAYDSMIAQWMRSQEEVTDIATGFSAGGSEVEHLRYGENPHQRAWLIRSPMQIIGAAQAELVQGKALSYNNLVDADGAFSLIQEFDPDQHAAVAIIKHNNPCGAACAQDLVTAYAQAKTCDPDSAFGGVIAVNRMLDERAAQEISSQFVEVIIAPDASSQALEILAKKKNLRLLLTGPIGSQKARLDIKPIGGGYLVQDHDIDMVTRKELKIVTKIAPSNEEIRDLFFAWKIAKHVKSNAIIYAKDLQTVGIGAGQMSRIDSARIAAQKAEIAAEKADWPEPRTIGSVCASDAFFPFADGLLTAAAAGARAIIQPGGSVRDKEVIEAADKAGLAMVFTGMRHFLH